MEEAEPQVCRLCGQAESMYIDVFSEEGTKRLLGLKIHSKINILIKPDDGLPKTICMRCLGTVEFLCEFHNKCHNTQKNLTSDIEQEANKNDTPEDKSQNDPESDKENVLPQQSTKRKNVKVSEQTKQANTIQEADENIICQEIENSDIVPIGKIDNSIVDALTNNENPIESLPLSLDATNSIESTVSDTETDTNKSSKIGDKLLTNRAENQVLNTETKSRRSRASKTDKNERKINKKSKNSPASSSKNRKSDSKVSNKTIDKYFSSQTEIKINNKDRENMNPKHNDGVPVKNSGRDEQENVIFEGTVINSMDGDTSIIMPIASDSLNDSRLVIDNAVMADGSEIVQAKEIIWVPENFQLNEPQKPKIVNANQPKTTSPAPGDEAETVGTNGIVVQTPDQDVSIDTSTKQVIFVEVQLPTKENTVTLPKSAGSIKRKRSSSVSTTSSERRNSEGKFAKISELMTEEQKKDIETQYSIDMSKVDEIKVGQNIEFLDKCKYRCQICNIIYPRLDKCQVHIWRHLDMKPFFCNVCDFSTLTVSNIRCHIRKSHMKFKPFECHLCHKSYNSATLLEEHLNIHTGSRPYQCDFCDFASTSKQVLVHHVLIHKSKKDVLCDICGKAFYSKGRMRAHKISHNRERAFKCKLCSTYVLHEEALEKHMLNVHAKDYVCKLCNKVYKSRKALHNHESVHSEAKFECPMCPNVYKSTHILKEHILKHQGIRQYKCKHCDKTFAQQSHLAAHSSVHSNVTYDCPGCGKGFNRHDNMKVHTKRCEKFLANPELKSLLTKRKISFSKNDTAKVAIRKTDATLEKTNDSNNTAEQDSIINDFELSGPVVEKEITSDKF